MQVDLLGTHFSHVSIFKGHNNDKYCYERSGLKKKLNRRDEYLITDDGFGGPNIVSRHDPEFKKDFGKTFQSGIRSIIENSFGNNGLNA